MGNKVQLLRSEKNWTQMELANQSGLSLRTIQRIEKGQVPKGHTLKSLAKTFNVIPAALNSGLDTEGIKSIRLINSTALTFLILPFGNILIPGILTFRLKNQEAQQLGKEILSVQIVWTIVTSILMMVLPLIQSQLSTNIPLFLIVLPLLFILNVGIIVKNGHSLNTQGDLSIRLKYNFL
ncbi:MAG: helix-turn-helix domain-containing protein [Bacteroidota bacterium]